MKEFSVTLPSNEPIEVCDWSAEWAEKFRAKAAVIREALGTRAKRIDHIGSTAIHGLAAKPIIDIQVSVLDFFDPKDGLIEPLQSIGGAHYYRVRDLAHRSRAVSNVRRYFKSLTSSALEGAKVITACFWAGRYETFDEQQHPTTFENHNSIMQSRSRKPQSRPRSRGGTLPRSARVHSAVR